MLNLFENEINRIQIINKMSEKQTKFMKNLRLEIDGAPNHFLNTLGDKDVSDFANITHLTFHSDVKLNFI